MAYRFGRLRRKYDRSAKNRTRALAFTEALPFNIKDDDPLRPLYIVGPKENATPSINFATLHCVRASLALKEVDANKGRALRNPDVSPQLSFVNLAGYGYSIVTVTKDSLETEFVCIPRRSSAARRRAEGRCFIARSLAD